MCPQNGIKYKAAISNSKHWLHTLIAACFIPFCGHINEHGRLVSRPPALFTSMRQPLSHAWHVMPKVSTQVYMLDCKILNLFRPRGNGRKRTKCNQFFIQHLISLIFAIHVSFIIPLPMIWILLTKPMQKSVTTVCLHCSFARLKNKHIGVLGTNVATTSWLHWSPMSCYTKLQTRKQRGVRQILKGF